jgi:ABC-2 type transport system permease protein
MRDATAETSATGSQLLSKYFEDHPDLAGAKADASDFGVVTLITQEQLDQRIQPVLDRFDDQLDRQQALVDRYRLLSPAVMAQASLLDIAGTSAHRYKLFTAEADAYHRAWRGHFSELVFNSGKMTADGVDRTPRFQFDEEPIREVATRATAGIWGLAAPTALLAVLTGLALRRFRTAG